MSPTFSVILPTYNRGYVVWKAIQSVLNQSYPFFELIIINDASTDDTAKVLQQFTDPRLRIVTLKKNQGPAHARNLGLKKAKGKYIAYLDSDNTWYPDFLETVHNAFQKYPDKVLVFSKKNYRLQIQTKPDKTQVLRDETTNHRKHFDLKRLWHRKIVIDTNVMCHTKEAAKKIGGWDENLNFWEDWEFTLRLSEKYPKGFLSLNRTLVDYEQTLDFQDRPAAFKDWEKIESYIYRKHQKSPRLKGQKWYPPDQGYKSTSNVITFLKRSKKVC